MRKTILFITFITVLIGNQLLGQTQPDWRKLHYLSEEEMLTPFDPSRDFYPTDPPEGEIRNVGEFDHMQGVLIRYPFGIPMSLIVAMAEDIPVVTIVSNSSQQQTVTTQYQNNGVNMDNVDFLIAPTDSYWVRDYGPWYVFDGNNQPGIVNFPYNRPRPNDNDIPIRMAEYLDIDLYGMNLISTGGNYMCDGMGIAASTDLVWEENPTLSHDDVAGYVNDYLGNEIYHVMEDPLGEYIKHIDCWSKFLSPGKVLVGEVPSSDYRYQDFEDAANYFASQTSSYGKPFEVYRVFTPGTYPNTPYTNSLILNNKVFVPLTGSQWDDEAIDSYEEAMPGYEIIGITHNGWENTDALHCRTKGIADIGMLYINHVPTLGSVAYQPTYEITADITACSGESIYSDSVFVYYKINGGSYITSVMQLESGNTYTGLIENILPQDTVSYYIYASDESGRNATQPYIGEPDPFVFTNIYFPSNEISFNPDTVKFLTPEQMSMGIDLHIINEMSYNTTINSITEYGDSFSWEVEEMPDLPYILAGNDTLTLNIVVYTITQSINLIIDTMFVETSLDTYSEIIAIDSALVSKISNTYEETDLVSVYPNPFTNQINFSIKGSESAYVTVQIFDISGKKVIDLSKSVIGNTLTLDTNLKPGSYFYRLEAGDIIKSGKLIKID